MIVNEEKTKFFVINGTQNDLMPLQVDGLTVTSCTSYVYLGSPFTCDGSVSSAIKMHARIKMGHVIKYVSFVKKNNDVPFIVKRRVFEAALMSALLYGCESWLGADLRPVIKLYNWAIKQLLGVRKSTPNDVCYAEAGYPALPDLIRQKQHQYFVKMSNERQGMGDDPLMFAMNLAREANIVPGVSIGNFLSTSVPDSRSLMQNVYERIAASNGSRYVMYRTINPSFSLHSVYTERHSINDRWRMAFTRFRVSSHNLAIETGRWNRRGRGRLPVEERLCTCGAIQSERHVIEECPLSLSIRQVYNIGNINELFNGKYDNDTSCKIITKFLDIYK